MQRLLAAFGISAIIAVACFATEPWDPVAERPSLRIYVRNYARVGGAALAAAAEAARDVLERAGVHSEWRDCTEPRMDKAERCDPAAGPGEILIELLGPRQCAALRGSGDALGVSRLPKDGSTARQAAVFLEKADAMTRAGGASMAQILGHAMAHEIGHLLLASGRHSASGLMRERWSERELQQAAWGQLLFTPDESARLRTAAARRRTEVDGSPDGGDGHDSAGQEGRRVVRANRRPEG